jgi:hypothetical protein
VAVNFAGYPMGHESTGRSALPGAHDTSRVVDDLDTRNRLPVSDLRLPPAGCVPSLGSAGLRISANVRVRMESVPPVPKLGPAKFNNVIWRALRFFFLCGCDILRHYFYSFNSLNYIGKYLNIFMFVKKPLPRLNFGA